MLPLVGLLVGAALVIGLGLSMLAAHNTEKVGMRGLQPIETMMAAEARARPPFTCTQSQSGASVTAQNGASGAEISSSVGAEQREAVCLYNRRLLTKLQLVAIERELRAQPSSPTTTWSPLGAQISPSPAVLTFWSLLITAELCGGVWFLRGFRRSA